MADKLRKLKDEASKLVQKGKLDKAINVFQEILAIDPRDITAGMKCGDLYRKQGAEAEAINCYIRVVDEYAGDGLLLKAIAVCKLILEIDPGHTTTQTSLADLYAKKTGRAAAVAQKAGTMPPPLPARATAPVQVTPVEEAPAVGLPTIPLFSDLSKNAFIQLMEQMKMRSVGPDEVIIREGDVDDSMFIISSGRVKVTRAGETGADMILAHLGEGAFFGEMALLSEAPRMASVIAVEDTTLFVVSREVISQVTKNFSSVTNIMMKFYRQRLLANLMSTSPIFRPLDGNQRKALIEQFKSREVPANEKIIEEGQKGDGLYMLLSGRAEVSKKLQGKRQVLAHLKEGDVFGEMSLLNNTPVSANIKSIRKSIVLKLPKKRFSEILSTHPQLLAHISDLSDERERTNKAIAAGKMKYSDEGLVVL